MEVIASPQTGQSGIMVMIEYEGEPFPETHRLPPGDWGLWEPVPEYRAIRRFRVGPWYPDEDVKG